jgi:hypothetical protein
MIITANIKTILGFASGTGKFIRSYFRDLHRDIELYRLWLNAAL